MNKKILKLAVVSTLLFHLGFMQALPVKAALDIYAKPGGGFIIGGVGEISQNDLFTYITNQSGMKGALEINWGTFNVGSAHTVDFIFTNHGQTTLNRVANTGGMSEIYGKLINSCGGSTSCSFQDTSKVILLNPNGVTFYNGSNVNLNSFTVSSYDGVLGKWGKPGQYDPDDRQNLILSGGGNRGDIVVESGADIYGAKQLTFAAPNVTTYLGSKISTNTGSDKYKPSVGYGNVNIFTGDGMSFAYNEVGHAAAVESHVTNGNNAGTITLGGEIDAGTVNIKAGSPSLVAMANPNANIVIRKGAVIKATNMIKGENGSIKLEAAGNISVGQAVAQEKRDGGAATNNLVPQRVTMTTYNKNAADAARDDIKSFISMEAKGDVTIENADMTTAVSNGANPPVESSIISVISRLGDVSVKNSNLTATGADARLFSMLATNVDSSNITAKDIYINAPLAGSLKPENWYGDSNKITNSTLTASNNVKIKAYAPAGNDISNTAITAGNKVDIQAVNGNKIANSTINAKDVNIYALKDNNLLDKVVIRGSNGTSAANSVTVKADLGSNTIQNKTDILADTISITASEDNVIDDSKAVGKNVQVVSTAANNIVRNNSHVEATGGTLTLDASAAGSNAVSNSSLVAGIVNVMAKVNNTLNEANINAQTSAKINAATGSNTIVSSNIKALDANNGRVDILAALNNDIKDGTNRTKIEGKTVNIVGAANTIKNTDIKTDNVTVTANTGDNKLTSVTINNGAGIAASKALIDSKLGNVVYDGGTIRALDFTTTARGSIKTENNALNATGSQVTMLAKGAAGQSILGNDINVALEGIGDRNLGVRAEGYNVTIKTTGELSVHKLWSTNDMTLTAAKIIAGNAYNGDIYNNPDVTKPDSGTARAYIRVDGWNFNSNGYKYDPDNSYELMPGQTPPLDKYPDGTTDFNNKHMLTYNNDTADKIFLVHRLPYECPPGPDPDPPGPTPGPNPPDPIAPPEPDPRPDPSILRLPLKYEPTSNLTPILDNRAGVDVIASAAKVQVGSEEDDDDETQYTTAE